MEAERLQALVQDISERHQRSAAQRLAHLDKVPSPLETPPSPNSLPPSLCLHPLPRDTTTARHCVSPSPPRASFGHIVSLSCLDLPPFTLHPPPPAHRVLIPPPSAVIASGGAPLGLAPMAKTRLRASPPWTRLADKPSVTTDSCMRPSLFRQVARKAGEQTKKVREVAFIQELTKQDRMLGIQEKLEEGETRRRERLAAVRERQRDTDVAMEQVMPTQS